MNEVMNKPPALPATTDALLALRRLKTKRTLNDLVEDQFVALMGAEGEFQKFIYAVYDEQAVEGKTECDDHEAARLIRDRARQHNVDELKDQKISVIKTALKHVLNRYGLGRDERRERSGQPPEAEGEIIQ